MQSGSSPGSTRDAPNAAVLVSIAGSKPTAFEAVSFQQVLGQDVARPLRRLSGCRARTLAGTCCTVETSVPMSGDAARRSARATYFRRLSVATHPTGFEQISGPEAAGGSVLQTKGFLSCLWRAGSCLVRSSAKRQAAGAVACGFAFGPSVGGASPRTLFHVTGRLLGRQFGSNTRPPLRKRDQQRQHF